MNFGFGGNFNSGPISCAYCQGTGREFTHPCPVCHGTGSNMAGQSPNVGIGGNMGMGGGMGFRGNIGGNMGNYQPESCGYCSGSGRDFCHACPACRGSGSVMVAQPASRCASCQGSGKEFTHICPGCRGSGWACTM